MITFANNSDRRDIRPPVRRERAPEALLLRHAPPSDDNELMRRVACGDAAALERLLSVHWQPVLRYARHLLGSLDAAEDAVQEAFVRLWANSAAWRPNGCVRAFLYRVTRNLVLNERRRERVRTLWARQADCGTQWCRTPAHTVEAHEIRDAVEAAMAALPQRRREVFWLARCQLMSHHEIAEVMGISVQTVANQMSAALATLRERLHPYIIEGGMDTSDRSANDA